MKALPLLAIALAGCSGLLPGTDRDEHLETGTPESGTPDSPAETKGFTGAADVLDASVLDASVLDASVLDASVLDVGVLDVGVLDASVLDVGVRDSAEEPTADEGSRDGSSDESPTDGPSEDDAIDVFDEHCTDSCDFGALRCDAATGFICEQRGGCGVWVRRLDCADNSFCCAVGTEVACVTPDARNCYACGRSCTGQTPFCSDQTKACVCDASSCGGNAGCDTATGTCAACTTPDANDTDFYANAKASAAGTGSAICPFRTITAALMLASKSDAPAKTVHVADGDYTAATETFPLEIRGGVTLEGTGADRTSITGMGLYYSDAPINDIKSRATVLVGDPNHLNAVRGLTIRSGEAVRVGNVGIIVDDGNLAVLSAGPAGPPDVPANTLVANAVIGPDFNVGVEVLARASSGSGGNVRVENTSLVGGWTGVFAPGCGATLRYGKINIQGSIFTGQAVSGFEFHGCTWVGVHESTFRDGRWGIQMVADGSIDPVRPRVDILSNTFDNLNLLGLSTQGTVDEISDNTFSSIVTQWDHPAVALFIDGGSILRARRNRFLGNDVGLLLYNSSILPLDATNVFDFGTEADPGQNDFRCNSSVQSSVLPYNGLDVAIDAAATTDWIFSLRGNRWDDAIPNVVTSIGFHDDAVLAPANGTDLFIGAGNPEGAVDVGGASRSAIPCAADHTSGRATMPSIRRADAGLAD